MTQQRQPATDWRVPYFSVWTGQAFSLVGSRVVQFALVWWLTRLTGSATVLTTATLVALVPEIVLGPIAGAYVDRWNRRLVMIASDAAVALASLWLAYLFWIDAVQIWHVYAIMFARALAGSFHWPAFMASTSLMVPDEHLTRVAGLNQSVGGMLNIIGPPLGALLLAVMSLYGIMLVDVATFGLAILPLLFVRVPQPERSEAGAGAGAQRPSIWSDLREGLRYVAGWRGLIALMGVAMIIKIALTPAFSLLPLLVSDYFKGNAAQFSLLEAVSGVGLLLGGLLLSAWGGFRRRIYTSLMGISALGLGFLALGLTPSSLFVAALASVFVVGLTIPLIDGPLMAIVQSAVAPDMQGRVFTLLGSLVAVTSPIGLIIAGQVSDLTTLQVWYIAAGLVCLVTGITMFFVPAIVNIEENQGAAVEAVEQLDTATTKL